MKKFLILGTKGMLGNTVKKYLLKKNLKITEINKKITKKNIFEIINEINIHKPNFVINCIGKIKQKEIKSIDDLYFVNGLLPLLLSKYLNENILLIHPSSDCVYNGKSKKMYNHKNIRDAEDDYGKSKILGESSLNLRKKILILRTSIIGQEIGNKKYGLLSWFTKNKLSTLKGYENHYWNGITTLEWSKLMLNISSRNNKSKILNIGLKNKISKYDLLKLINNIYFDKNKKKKIIKTKSFYCNRSLKPDIISSSISTQIRELKGFI